MYNTSIQVYNTSIQYIFNPHLLQNTSPTYGTRNFLRFLTKKFLLQNMFYTFYFTSPKAFPKIFPKNSLELFTSFQLQLFQCFKLAVVKDFCFQFSCFCSLLLKMNSHFNLDFSKLLLVHKPATVGSQLIDTSPFNST